MVRGRCSAADPVNHVVDHIIVVEFFRRIVCLILNKPELVLFIVAEYVGPAYAVPLRKKIVCVSPN